MHYPGAVYHVISHGVNDQEVYLDERDRTIFLNILERVRMHAKADILAYCLMGNHFHLAIKVARIPLSAMMARILTRYAKVFNWRHDRKGHLFQARYGAFPCRDDRYLSSLVRYIHLNPVRAGLVEQPWDWRWSSYRAYRAVGKDGLVTLTSDLPDLEAEIVDGFDPCPKPGSVSPPPSLLRVETSSSLTIEQLSTRVAAEAAISIQEILSRSRRHVAVRARNRLIQLAAYDGHRATAIAAALHVSLPTISRALAKYESYAKPDTNIE